MRLQCIEISGLIAKAVCAQQPASPELAGFRNPWEGHTPFCLEFDAAGDYLLVGCLDRVVAVFPTARLVGEDSHIPMAIAQER